jgi:hypothetical protein
MKLSVKIALFVVSFIAIAAVMAGLYKYNLKHTDMAKARPDFIITSTALQKEFEDNETAASAKYINKIIEVSGVISSVAPADSTHTNIALKTESDISAVICTLHLIGEKSDLKSGEAITLRGECSGFLMDVLLNNCAIVTKRK